MKIKNTPVAISGLAVGFSSLGNLLESYSIYLKYFCGIISFLLLLLLTVRIFIDFDDFKREMSSPIVFSIFATYPMTIVALSDYISPIIGRFSFYLWGLGLIFHAILIVIFSIKFLVGIDHKKVFASYFVMFVGLVIGGFSASNYNLENLGTLLFWFGFISFVILFVLISRRYYIHKDIAEPFRPLVCIYTSPVNILIVGYIQSVNPKNTVFLLSMLVVSLIIYLVITNLAFKFVMGGNFFPSFSSLTFPFVISAIASKQTFMYMANIGNPISILSPVILVQTGIATLFCFYVLFKYIKFLSY